MTGRLRLALAAALLLGFHAAVASFLLLWLVLVAGTVYLTTRSGTATFPGTGFLFIAGSAPLVHVLVRAIRASLFFVEAPSAAHAEVSRGQAPALSALVAEVVRRSGVEETVTLRLTSEPTAGLVDEDTRHLGLSPGNLVLCLGLPLLATLTPDQARAVVAHELAHLSLRHHRSRAFTARLETSLTVARDSLKRFGKANRFVGQYAAVPRMLIALHVSLFRRLVQPVRRRQELEADELAARLYGAPALAEALAKQAMAEVLWKQFREVFLDRAPDGALPADPFRGFARALSNAGIQHKLPLLRELVADATAAPDAFGSSHPALTERLRALGRQDVLSAPTSFPPDAPLLPRLASGDLARLLPDHPYDRAVGLPWSEWVSAWAAHQDAFLVDPLLEAAARHHEEDTPLTLRRVLGILHAGRRMALARDLAGRLPAERRGSDEPLDLLARAVVAWLHTGLAPDTGANVLLSRLATEAVRRPAETSGLSLHLAVLGVDENTFTGRTAKDTEDDDRVAYTSRKEMRRRRLRREHLSEETRELIAGLGRVTLTLLLVGYFVGVAFWSMRGPAPSPSGPGGSSPNGWVSTPSTPGIPTAAPLATVLPPGWMPEDPLQPDPLRISLPPMYPIPEFAR